MGKQQEPCRMSNGIHHQQSCFHGRGTERLPGVARDALERWDWREAADALEVPPAKFGRLLTLQDAVRSVARNWPGPAASTV